MTAGDGAGDGVPRVGRAADQSLVATAFAGFALNTRVAAARSEASLQRSVTAVLEAQLQRAELRLSQFLQLEERLQAERAAVTRERTQLRESRRDLEAARAELQREHAAAAAAAAAVAEAGADGDELGADGASS